MGTHSRTLILATVAIGILALFLFTGMGAAQTTTPPAQGKTFNINNVDFPALGPTQDIGIVLKKIEDNPGLEGFLVESGDGTMYAIVQESERSWYKLATAQLLEYFPSNSTFRQVDCLFSLSGTNAFILQDIYKQDNPVLQTTPTISAVLDACNIEDKDYVSGEIVPISLFEYLKRGSGIAFTAPSSAAVKGASVPIPSGTATAAPGFGLLPDMLLVPEDPYCALGSGPIKKIALAENKMNAFASIEIPTDDQFGYLNNPYNIIFKDAGTGREYLLQVWHLSKNKDIYDAFLYTARENLKIVGEAALKEAGIVAGGAAVGLVPVVGPAAGWTVGAWATAEVLGGLRDDYAASFPDATPTIKVDEVASLTEISSNYTLGMRLCLNEGGSYQKMWETVKHHEVDGLVDYEANFYSNQGRGPVSVQYEFNLEIADNDFMEQIKLDASLDNPGTIMRFRIGPQTLAKIKEAAPEFKDPLQNGTDPDNSSDELTDSQLLEKITTTFKSTHTGVEFTADSFPYLEGALNGSGAKTYLSTAQEVAATSGSGFNTTTLNFTPVKPDTYTITISIPGFKSYRTTQAVSHIMLSTSDPARVTGKDILELEFPNITLERSCSGTCSNILSCLACLDTGIVSTYQK